MLSCVWSFQFILNVSWVIRSESGSWNRPLPHPPIHHCVYQVSPRCLNWLHNSLLFKLITLEGHRSPCALICCQEGADFIQIGPAKENKLQLRFCRTKLFVNLNKSHHALLCSHAIPCCRRIIRPGVDYTLTQTGPCRSVLLCHLVCHNKGKPTLQLGRLGTVASERLVCCDVCFSLPLWFPHCCTVDQYEQRTLYQLLSVFLQLTVYILCKWCYRRS